VANMRTKSPIFQPGTLPYLKEPTTAGLVVVQFESGDLKEPILGLFLRARPVYNRRPALQNRRKKTGGA
jgi:hypothetical protein